MPSEFTADPRPPVVPGQAAPPAARALREPVLILVLGVLLFLGAVPIAGLLPDRRASDPDAAGFAWKREAADRPGSAAVILSGDSACTTGIDPTLEAAGPWRGRMLNLGLVIDLPWTTYADALQRGVAANAGNARAAVLLVSPQRLLLETTGAHFDRLWRGDPVPDDSWASLDSLIPHARTRGRTLWPWNVVEHPLTGNGRQAYGFNTTIIEYLATRQGAFVDPGTFHPGRRRNTLDLPEALPGLEGIDAFRRIWQGAVPLVAVLAPIPESLIGSDFPARRQQALNRWAAVLGTTNVLHELPASLPDPLFASATHLNEVGQRLYTRRLAKALAERFPGPSR